MNNYNWLLIFLLIYSYQTLAKTNDNNQTIIEDIKPQKDDTAIIVHKEQDADQHIDDQSMLFHIPGLTINNNGPLSSSPISYRGLLGYRLPIHIDDLSLNNPLYNLSDANAMFLFAAKSIEARSIDLAIKLPQITHKTAKGIVGYGSLNTMKLSGMLGIPIGQHSTAFVAMQASSTNGDFTFSSPYITKESKPNFIRNNNDQHRIQGIVKLDRHTENNEQNLLFAISGHEGGIPGFAFSPTNNLRNKAVFYGLSTKASQKFDQSKIGFNLANSIFYYHTRGEKEENLTASTHDLSLKYQTLKLPSWLYFDLSQHLIIEKAYELNKTRIGAGFAMNRKMKWSGKLKPSSSAKFNMIAFNEHGLLFKKEFSLQIEPSSNVSLTGKFTRSQRLPTFMELYTKNNFYMGNENLVKESVMDFAIGTNIKISQSIRISLLGFYGFLSDLIVDVPYLSNMLMPINISSARRFGIDNSMIFSPIDWLVIESSNALLKTMIKATSSPLPNAPWFLGVSKIKFGDIEKLSFTIQSRYKGESFGNIYGTLRSEAYGLFDILLSSNIIKHLGLSISLSNIFDHKTAKDSYETPLPGRLFYVQIAMGDIL